MPVAAPLAVIALVVGLAAFFATLSRGGLIAFATTLVVGLFYGGRKMRPALVALIVVAVTVATLTVTTSPVLPSVSPAQTPAGEPTFGQSHSGW